MRDMCAFSNICCSALGALDSEMQPWTLEMRYSKTCFWRVPNYDDHCTVVVVIGVPSEIRCFCLRKATCSQRTWWGHRERAMSATIVQGKLPKGQFQRRPKTYISGAYRLQEDILKICVSNTRSLFFLTPLGPRVCSRKAHKPNGGRSPGGTGR